MESFKHYTAMGATGGDAVKGKWTDANVVLGIAGGRVQFTSVGHYLSKTLGAHATWIVGFNLELTSLPGERVIVNLLDSGTRQVDLRVLADGTLRITRSGTALATSTNALSIGSRYHVEFKVVIHDTTGTAEARVDGVNWVSITAADTKNTSNATANQVRFGGLSADSVGGYLTDIYIMDGSGTARNTFISDQQVDCLFPNGNGTYTEWDSLVGGTSHHQGVDEAAPDDDTSYIDTATVNDRDSSAFQDLAAGSGVVNGVQVVARARKTNAGDAKLARVYRRGGADNTGPDQPLG